MANITGRTYTVTGLSVATSYSFEVLAINDQGIAPNNHAARLTATTASGGMYICACLEQGATIEHTKHVMHCFQINKTFPPQYRTFSFRGFKMEKKNAGFDVSCRSGNSVSCPLYVQEFTQIATLVMVMTLYSFTHVCNYVDAEYITCGNE